MWLLTLTIGLIVGWFARTMYELIKDGIEKLSKVERDIEARDEEESGVTRPGQYTEQGGIRKLPPVPSTADEDSPIVRSPSPREVALEEAAKRERPRTL